MVCFGDTLRWSCVLLATLASLPIVGCGPKLDLGPRDMASITIYQRETRDVPCSAGSLKLSLGDITGEQVLVSVTDQHKNSLIDRAEMRAGDKASLTVQGRSYFLVMDQLVNLLVGEDYANVCIMRPEAWHSWAIEHLLSAIEKSGLVFIRNGVELDGPSLALHLRQKQGAMKLQHSSVDEFVDKVASKSSMTGEPYMVKFRDDRSVVLAEWLRQQPRICGSNGTVKVPTSGEKTTKLR